MGRPKKFLPLALGFALLCHWPATAKPTFSTSEIEGKGSEIMLVDLDGDGLDDIVLLDQTNFSVFYQDSKSGFARKPQLEYPLADPASLIWPARLGGKTDSLLLMTSNGVAELDFINRTSPPVRQQIITQPTIIPDSLKEPQALYLPMSANTGTGWPLILLPVADGLQVWQHTDTWRLAQFIGQAVDTHTALLPLTRNPGYSRMFRLSLNIGDVNGDGRDDLMVMRSVPGTKQIYTLYLQNTNGLFDLEPALTYTNTDDWHTALAWLDLNHDGKLDLIKSTVSDEPSFVPGLQSGKVLVAEYLADEHGQIPATPSQVFRKSDWSGFLPLVDVDGDGFTDIILGSVPIDSRDGVRNVVTAGRLNLNLRFHFSRPGQAFPREPDYERDLEIYFDNVLFWTESSRIYSEKFLSLNGDFNGDGKKDLLVRDHSDAISVYFFNSRETGFSPRADLTFSCPELMDWWQIKDLNGDCVSDLVVKLRNDNLFRIFISHGK